MRPDLVIRREEPGDVGAVRSLLDRAFPVPDGAAHAVETVLVDGLRADGDVSPS